jgi:hypothetical protein
VLESDSVAATLAERGEQQRREAQPQLRVLHDFGFVDRASESGITFRNRAVEDGGKFYKMTHYDHGNGVTAADVDGDGLLDLYFSTQIGSNELWHNLGEGRFENWTSRAGVGLADRIGVSASFADVDNDGDPDLYATTVRHGSALFENLGDGRFRDRSAESGVAYQGHASGSVFLDFDLDGDLDLLVTAVGSYTEDQIGPGGYFLGRSNAFSGHLFPERSEYSRLYRNLGDWRFEDATRATRLIEPAWSGDALVTDLDGDRYPDIYFLNMQGDDRYWRNQGGRSFVESTDELFPRTPWGTMGAVQLDADGDGNLDIYLTDMHSDMPKEAPPERERLKTSARADEGFLQGGDNNIFGNALYRNNGDGSWSEASDALGLENYWPWGVSAGDLNADGWDDVFVTAGMNFPWRYGVNSLLLNNAGGGFVPSEFLLGVEPRRDGRTHTHWFDLDCIGADRGHRMCARRPGGRWKVEGALGSRSSLIADLDGDGDLDIVTNDFHSAPQVLLSDLAQRGVPAYLEVELEGTKSNRDGLGARVELQVGERKLVRYVNGKTGYLSQGDLPLYFGLGEHEAAEGLRIVWPSGCDQTLVGGLASGRRIVVVEECGGVVTR